MIEFGSVRTVLLIPTFNERNSISATLDDIFSVAPSVDVIVIDDSSPDGTGKIVHGHPRFGDGLQLLSRTQRTGLADAYRTGMAQALAAGYERIVQMDADGSHRAEDLPRLLCACSNDDVLVIGTRWMSGGRVENWSWLRQLISRGGNRFAQIVLSCDLPDMTSGYRVWGHGALRGALAAEGKTMAGYGFQVEMAWTHWRRKDEVRSVPICFVERTAGKSKMSVGIAWEAARGVIELRLRQSRRS